MKTYEVVVRLRGEGYATRTVLVNAISPEAAKKNAIAV